MLSDPDHHEHGWAYYEHYACHDCGYYNCDNYYCWPYYEYNSCYD